MTGMVVVDQNEIVKNMNYESRWLEATLETNSEMLRLLLRQIIKFRKLYLYIVLKTR